MSASDFKWKIFSNFAAFSEYPKFTGAHDKVADDVVNRICRDNNKPLGSNDPGVKLALIALDSRIVGAQKFVVITADSVHHIISIQQLCQEYL